MSIPPKNINELQTIDFVKIFLNDSIGTSAFNWVRQDPQSGSYFIPVVTASNRLTTNYYPIFLFKMAEGESWGLGKQVQIQLKAGTFKYQDSESPGLGWLNC